jgi:hypothetical protein
MQELPIFIAIFAILLLFWLGGDSCFSCGFRPDPFLANVRRHCADSAFISRQGDFINRVSIANLEPDPPRCGLRNKHGKMR